MRGGSIEDRKNAIYKICLPKEEPKPVEEDEEYEEEEEEHVGKTEKQKEEERKRIEKKQHDEEFEDLRKRTVNKKYTPKPVPKPNPVPKPQEDIAPQPVKADYKSSAPSQPNQRNQKQNQHNYGKQNRPVTPTHSSVSSESNAMRNNSAPLNSGKNYNNNERNYNKNYNNNEKNYNKNYNNNEKNFNKNYNNKQNEKVENRTKQSEYNQFAPYRPSSPQPSSTQPSTQPSSTQPSPPTQLEKRQLTNKELSYLSLLFDSVNVDQDKPEILPIINSKQTFTDTQPLLMNVPPDFAIPFLQLFGNIPEKLLLSPTFTVPNKNLTINIPSPITIGVTTNEDKFQFSFFPTNSASSNDIQAVINIALNSIAWSQWRLYAIKNIDNQTGFTEKDFLALAQKYNTVIQILKKEESLEDESLSIQFRVLQIAFKNTEKTKQFDQDIQKMFENAKLCSCKKCKQIYVKGNCSDCLEYYHPGEQIPFESGEWEEIDYDDNGEEVVLYNYSCCGVIPFDELGCQSRNNGHHEEASAQPISEFAQPVDQPLYVQE